MKIKKEEIIESLNRSGYFLESRVLEILSKNNYENFPNQTYPDKITGKSREIDILSDGQRITENINLNQFLHFEFKYKLSIECINNDQPVAFFKRPDKDPFSIFGKFLYSKVERPLAEKHMNTGNTPDFQFNTFTVDSKEFHYNQLTKNTQYCSFSKKRGQKTEWMASHPDGLHDTLNKLVDYTEHQKETYEDWMNNHSAWRRDVFTTIFFPVIVLQNELIEVSENKGKVEIENKNHIIFDFKKYSDNRNGFLVDIITESYLPEYLNKVNNSVTELKNSMVEFYRDKEIVEIEYPKAKLKKN